MIRKDIRKDPERLNSNLEQLFTVLDTAISQARDVDIAFEELLRFAAAGFFNDVDRAKSLLNHHKNNNMTNIIVFENMKKEVEDNQAKIEKEAREIMKRSNGERRVNI